MAIPAFVEFTDPETQYKSGIGQDYARKMKDNFTNLNARTLQLEKYTRVFDHFISSDHTSNSLGFGKSFECPDDDAAYTNLVDKWAVSENWLYIGYDGTDSRRSHFNATKPARSVARISLSGGVSNFGYGHVFSRKHFRFDQVTRPIIFEARMKISADGYVYAGLRHGITQDATGRPSTDRAGVWLERVDSTNWRFVSFDGSRFNGSNFAKPTAGNWFTVKIEFTDTPSNRAICSVDGVVKETITSNLDTDTELRAWWCAFQNNFSNFDLDSDRAEFSCLGLADAA